jgi:hypothetical protein
LQEEEESEKEEKRERVCPNPESPRNSIQHDCHIVLVSRNSLSLSFFSFAGQLIMIEEDDALEIIAWWLLFSATARQAHMCISFT